MTDVVESALAGPERLAAAHDVVNRFTKYAAVGGLVPVLDLVAIGAVQLKLLERLSHLYNVKFSENLGKEVIGTIISAGTGWNLGNAALLGLSGYIRYVPVAGQLVGLAVMPAFAAASTAALGRIFLNHYEGGGTLLDIDVKSAREDLKKDFARAKRPPRDTGKTADATA
jgi:uncharacterized protein (DUF697 family)